MSQLSEQGAQAAVNFEFYDSTKFPTFPESIAHARRNPLLIENLSDWRETTFDNDQVLVQESTCLFKDVLHFFDEVLEEAELPEAEYYRPEITAKRLYGSADLWFTILLVNDIQTVTKYNKSTIRYIPGRELKRLEKFARRAGQVVRAETLEDEGEVIIP